MTVKHSDYFWKQEVASLASISLLEWVIPSRNKICPQRIWTLNWKTLITAGTLGIYTKHQKLSSVETQMFKEHHLFSKVMIKVTSGFSVR